MSDNNTADQRTRPAQAGETDVTRFGMDKSAAEEPSAAGAPIPGGSSDNDTSRDGGENNEDEDVR